MKETVGAVREMPAKYHKPIQLNSTPIGLNWLCFLAGNSQKANIYCKTDFNRADTVSCL